MRFSPLRLATASLLGLWSVAFWFLLISERTQLYLSSRTAWVVPVGAIITAIGFFGRLFTSRTRTPEPVGTLDAVRLFAVAIPVAAVLLLPPASLGTYAASRRSSFVSGGIARDPASIETGHIDLADVAGALRSTEGARALAGRAGSRVGFVGFVAREPGMAADEFLLTRFLVSCCVADALSVQVRVTGATPGRFKADEWVRVEGRMYPVGSEVLVDATAIENVERPKHPYLST